MKNNVFCLLIALTFSLYAFAQDRDGETGDQPLSPSRLNALTTGSSPFRELPKTSDRVFVRDEQSGALDTGCTFRQDGPLVIKVPIDRVITKVDPDLQPLDYLNVINRQVQFIYLSGKLKLQMPVYDIDPTEQDKVYFNGHYVGTLYGSNNTWVMNYFDVPIEKVRFGKYVGSTLPSIASDNEITIDIDTTNERWCTAVDWVGLSFEAMSPIVLIHGNSSDGQFFTRQGLTTVLNAQKLLYDDTLNFLPNSNYIEDPVIDNNGNIVSQPNNFQLNEHLKKITKAFGVDSLHLVMHSKGGLDTRSYLSVYQPINEKQFKILSYTTIGTPHNGSILADIVTKRAEVAKRADRIEYDNNFPTFSRQVFGISGVALGHYNLTTDYIRAFNQRNVDSISRMGIQFNVTGSDADLNRNGAIGLAPECGLLPPVNESVELAREGFGVPISNFPTLGVATVMYKTIRDVQSVRVEEKPITVDVTGPDGTVQQWTVNIPKFVSTPTSTPQVNDTLVSKESSQGIGGFERVIGPSGGQRVFYDWCTGANHANIPGRSAVDVVAWIWGNDLSKGDWGNR